MQVGLTSGNQKNVYHYNLRLNMDLIFLLTLFIGFCYFVFTLFRHNIKTSTIAIDLDTLVNIEHILKRGNIYIKNKPQTTLPQYVSAHIYEQEVIPSGILRALHYQNLGYDLVFYSFRPETLRVATAKVLNEWGLKGELYLNTPNYLSNYTFKVTILEQIKITRNLVGIIENSELVRDFCENILKIKTL